ncbi:MULTISPECIES: hypothetical protein [Eikenella]|jgi:hypothetical protein|uniref:Uncharacterized protein n=1 Tax=Eikenella corrodens TaxID=539 RepID=A0A1A9RK71_EIKCO|nr:MULTISPECIES: hypothetical protein [Eikenella]MDU4299639.1 hypothetical protein [Eikenella corrodens]OAM18786.1 hypothetical protein A7P90_05805 [Eikenella corrodens]OAM20168.1 hypothetical protein A7P84_02885 [Eikenella corrodens]OFN62672.1 hypothetical protein HMPREF2541_05450 [Eikenella sp. HMSC061C02]OWP27958.1 hypothetical protein CA838_06880 [Eikenella corrodens]
MTTNKNTDEAQTAGNSSSGQTSDPLVSLFQKLNLNPQAAEAMKQALAKTKEELNQKMGNESEE